MKLPDSIFGEWFIRKGNKKHFPQVKISAWRQYGLAYANTFMDLLENSKNSWFEANPNA